MIFQVSRQVLWFSLELVDEFTEIFQSGFRPFIIRGGVVATDLFSQANQCPR